MVTNFRILLLCILTSRVIEIPLGVVENSVVDILMSANVALLGAFTFLICPFTCSLITELTHPIVTTMPNLLMLWLAALTAVLISNKPVLFEIVPLAISALLIFGVDEDDGWLSLRR
jgi:hypothetical protein